LLAITTYLLTQANGSRIFSQFFHAVDVENDFVLLFNAKLCIETRGNKFPFKRIFLWSICAIGKCFANNNKL